MSASHSLARRANAVTWDQNSCPFFPFESFAYFVVNNLGYPSVDIRETGCPYKPRGSSQILHAAVGAPSPLSTVDGDSGRESLRQREQLRECSFWRMLLPIG